MPELLSWQKAMDVLKAENTRLQAERDAALDAMNPFADAADRIDSLDERSESATPDDASYRYYPHKGPSPTVGDCRKAREVLSSIGQGSRLLAIKDAAKWMSDHRAVIVFAEEAEHIADFFSRYDAAVSSENGEKP